MADWKDQLKTRMGKKTLESLYEILRFNPNLPIQSIYRSLQQRGHTRVTVKTLKRYMEGDDNIESMRDTSRLHNRPIVYNLKEGAK